MEPKRIYLAGPINSCTDEQCCGWREYVKREVEGVEFIDPMRRDFRGCEGDHTADIIEGDKADIVNCDIFYANAKTITAGTMMELLFAWEQKKIVVVITESKSPWITYHATKIERYMVDGVAYLKTLRDNPSYYPEGTWTHHKSMEKQIRR